MMAGSSSVLTSPSVSCVGIYSYPYHVITRGRQGMKHSDQSKRKGTLCSCFI